MPYVVRDAAVYKKTNGLKKVGQSKNRAAAEKHARLLRAIEHGFKPTRRK